MPHSLFGKALTIYRSAIGDHNLQVAATLTGLAYAAVWKSDYPLAEHYEREALSIFQQTVSRNHPDNAVALAILGYILTQRDKFAEAEQVLNEALQIERTVFGADNQRIAATEADFGVLYDREGDSIRAIAATETALQITRERRGSGHYLTGYYLDALANLFLSANNLPAAEADAREALAIYAKALPARHLYIASTHQLLGEVLLRRGSAGRMRKRSCALALDMNVATGGRRIAGVQRAAKRVWGGR